MQDTKKKIGIVTVIAALLLTAVITCLQLAGVWNVSVSECGETVSMPMYATSNEQIP